MCKLSYKLCKNENYTDTPLYQIYLSKLHENMTADYINSNKLPLASTTASKQHQNLL